MSNNQGHYGGASKLPHDLSREAREELDGQRQEEPVRRGNAFGSSSGVKDRERYSTAAASRCLTADSTSDDREIALRKLANVAATLDALGRAILREAAIGCLGSIGVNSPARLVDAALALVADEPTADTLEAPKPWEDVVDGASLLFALASTAGAIRGVT